MTEEYLPDEFEDEFFESKARALVFALIESAVDHKDRTDEMNLVLEDLDLTEDAFELLLSLAGVSATFVMIMAQRLELDPAMLWHRIVGG